MDANTLIRLNEDSAHQFWRWILARQGVRTLSGLASALDVSQATLGLHAARNASPYTTVASRLNPFLSPESIKRMLGTRELVTVRCMRQTLHALPVGLASIAHSATLSYRLQHVRALSQRLGAPNTAVEECARQVVIALESHAHLGHREIEGILIGRGANKSVARLGLKLAWEDGRVVYWNRSDTWQREVRAFVHGSRLPGLVTLPAQEARDALVVEYFSRYGPATLKDASWWSGLSQRTIAGVLRRHQALAVETPWSRNPCYIFTEQYESFRDDERQEVPGTNFLGHEDVALKAYFETRGRYLGRVSAGRVFNQIGEALPTIVRDGYVVGRWRWDESARRVRYRHFDTVRAVAVEEARAQAAQMTARLRAGHAKRAHPKRGCRRGLKPPVSSSDLAM